VLYDNVHLNCFVLTSQIKIKSIIKIATRQATPNCRKRERENSYLTSYQVARE